VLTVQGDELTCKPWLDVAGFAQNYQDFRDLRKPYLAWLLGGVDDRGAIGAIGARSSFPMPAYLRTKITLKYGKTSNFTQSNPKFMSKFL
jgi:hypothetical protein